jgi:hypothetical protein
MATYDNQSSPYFGVISDDNVLLFRSDNPSWRQTTTPILGRCPLAGIVGTTTESERVPFAVLFFEASAAIISAQPSMMPYFAFDGDYPLDFEALPRQPERNTLYQPPLAGHLESTLTPRIEWITKDGQIYTTSLRRDASKLGWPPGRYLRSKPARGIHGSIVYCPDKSGHFSLWDYVDEPIIQGNPVAAFSHGANGILVVNANGTLTHVSSSRLSGPP